MWKYGTCAGPLTGIRHRARRHRIFGYVQIYFWDWTRPIKKYRKILRETFKEGE